MFKHLFSQERSKTVIIYYNCFQIYYSDGKDEFSTVFSVT